MHFLRKTAAAFAFSFLTTLLFGFGLAWSVYHVFGTPHDLEISLSKSGIYESLVSELLKTETQDTSTTTAIPMNVPGVQQAVESAFPPSLLQSDTEQIINAVYSWTTGKSTSLNYTVDLSSAKQQLANGVGQYVASRLTALPKCTSITAETLSVDPFNATCAPPGLSVAAVSTAAEQNVLNSDFLQNPVLTAHTATGNGKTVQSDFRIAPSVYKHIKQGIIGGAIGIVALGVAVVYLAETRKSGLYRLSAAFISMGVLSIVMDWLSVTLLEKVAQKIGSSTTDTNKALEQQIVNLIESLARDVRTWDTLYGVILVVLGLGTLTAVYFTHRQQKATPTPLRSQTTAAPGDSEQNNSDTRAITK